MSWDTTLTQTPWFTAFCGRPEIREDQGLGRRYLTAGGTFTEFEAPGGGTKGQGTWALTLNDAGAIVGFVLDSRSVFHGFIRTP